MFCPNCGAQNPDSAAFCGSCGSSFQGRSATPTPTSTPAAVPAAGGAVPAPKAGGLGSLANPKIIAIAGAIVLVLLVVLIRMFACSAGSSVNLVDIVNKPSSDVASILKGQKEQTVFGYTYFTNNEELPSLVYKGDYSEDALKRYNGSYVFAVQNSSGSLSLDRINSGANPTCVGYDEIVISDKLTCKEIAERVAKVAPFEKVYVYRYTEDGSFTGMAKGGGCVSSISAYGYGNVYILAVQTYSIGEDSSGTSYSNSFDNNYADFDSSDYYDSFKK